MKQKIILKINDKDISLNPFVQEMFFHVVKGMIVPLNNLPENKEKIEIIIKDQ